MYNEKNNIVPCLDSLYCQDYPTEKIEVCVVDGVSTDGSCDLVKEFSKNHPGVKLYSNPDRITPKSLNIGIRAAKGEVVIILGAHTKLRGDFISKNIKNMREKSVLCVGGTQINQGDSYVQQAIGNAMSSPFGIMSAPYRFRKTSGYVDTVVYAAYHKSLFDEVGYFDENRLISEDAEFNWRIRKAGYKIYFSPEIISYYYPRKNIIRLLWQFFCYGIFRVNVVKKHSDALKLLHLIPAVFVFCLGLTAILSFFSEGIRAIFLVLSVFYIVYLILASVTSAKKFGWKYFPVLPVAFMTMQISFGAGFLLGLFKTDH